MNRHDLVRARATLPELEPIWQSKREQLESERDMCVMKLEAHLGDQDKEQDPAIAEVYRRLIRVDRSLWFLDRALMHLDDLDHGTKYAQSVPLTLQPEHKAAMQRNA